MSRHADGSDDSSVLRNKRDATRYRILVQIAERQPAVSQQEVANAVGITAQAVSDYLRDLIDLGFVEKHGRGRYEVTKEGVDWLISRTDELRTFARHVSEDVIEQIEIETAIAATHIEEGQTVSLAMRDGVLRALAEDTGGATAIAVTDAGPDQDVGVTDIQGLVDYELGTVTALTVPQVQDGGGHSVETHRVADLASAADVTAVGGTEALAAAMAADVSPDIRYGTAGAVREAATKGLDVFLLVTTDRLSSHTDALREQNIGYEVVDTVAE